MRKLMDAGAVSEATSYGKAALAKTMNSLISSDAVQLQEFIGRYSSLLSATDMSALAGKGPVNPNAIAFKILTTSPDNKKKIIDDLTSRAFEANPTQFLQDAMQMHDDSARAHNKVLQEQVINPTSPRVAASLGAIPVKLLIEAAPAPQQAPIPPSAPQATQVINSATGVQQGASQPQFPLLPPAGAVKRRN
jgi:hypothetical protein